MIMFSPAVVTHAGRFELAGHAAFAEARLAIADEGEHMLVDLLDGRNQLRRDERRIAVVQAVDVGQHDRAAVRGAGS